MAEVQNVPAVLQTVKREGTKQAKLYGKSVISKLTAGVYKAMSNANIKRNIKRPKPTNGLSGAKGADFTESGFTLPAFTMTRSGRVQIADSAAAMAKDKRYKVVARRSGTPLKPLAHEIFRKPGVGQPKSWKATGIADLYLRRRWLSKQQSDVSADVSIQPSDSIPDFADNKTFLNLLEKGGSMLSGPKLAGYKVYFGDRVGKKTEISFAPLKAKKRSVRVKGYGFVDKALARIKKTLAQQDYNNISNATWRKLGSNS